MKHIYMNEQLNVREIKRDMDTDYFIETHSMPVNLLSTVPYLSRIQFPLSRAILLRTSPVTSLITIHLLGDTDLYSSFVNFEVDLATLQLNILLGDYSIDLSLSPIA